MAPITLLGSHRPAGLEYLIAESVLPHDPSPESYTWATYHEYAEGLGEEEIVYTDQCVVWSLSGTVRRLFRFDEEGQKVTQALLTWFSPDDSSLEGNKQPDLFSASTRTERSDEEVILDNDVEQKSRSKFHSSKSEANGSKVEKTRRRALVVILNQQAHVYFWNGSNYVVHLPFEVERAFPAIRGLLLQRKVSPKPPLVVSPVVPQAPPNSFWTSLSQSWHPSGSPGVASTGNTKRSTSAETGAPTTLADLVVKPQDVSAEELPRLYTLTDPLSEVGLVVQKISTPDARGSFSRQSLDRLDTVPFTETEEILYVSGSDELLQSSASRHRGLTLLLSFNHETRTYTVWSGVCPYHDKTPSRRKSGRASLNPARSRRQSFFATPHTGRSTPALRRSDVVRESFGAGQSSLPSSQNVRTNANRTSESFTLDRTYDGDMGSQLGSGLDFYDESKAGNRRVSSLVARSELAGHDQNTFTDMVRNPAAGGGSFATEPTRGQSMKASQERNSFGKSYTSPRASLQGPRSVLSDVDESMQQDAVDNLSMSNLLEMADELDLAGHSLHLDGLKHELVLTRVASIPAGRIHASAEQATAEELKNLRVVTVSGDSGKYNQQHIHRRISMFIVNRSTGRMHELQLHLQTSNAYFSSHNLDRDHFHPFEAFLEDRGTDILDAVKISDGGISRLLFLQKSTEGDPQLCLQTEVAALTAKMDSESRNTLLSMSPDLQGHLGQVDRLERPSSLGRVDLCTATRLYQHIQIRLRPRNAYVSRILDVCRSLLLDHAFHIEDAFSTWLSVEQSSQQFVQYSEWNSLVITVFIICLNLLGRPDLDNAPQNTQHQQSNSTNSSMPLHEDHCWGWTPKSYQKKPRIDDYIIHCIQIAQKRRAAANKSQRASVDLSSEGTESQFGQEKILVLHQVFIGLHLLREEEKLDITSQELCGDPTHRLTPVLAQVATWLGWQSWGSEPGSFYDVDDASLQQFILDKSYIANGQLPPFEPPSILDWLHNTVARSTNDVTFPLLDQIRSAGKQQASFLEEYLWPAHRGNLGFKNIEFTPRTNAIIAFLTKFNQGDETSAETFEALLAQRIDSHILETLPEGIVSLLRNCILQHQTDPSTHWNPTMLNILGREDLNALLNPGSDANAHSEPWVSYEHLLPARDVRSIFESLADLSRRTSDIGVMEGTKIGQYIFRHDNRIREVDKLLDSHVEAVAEIHPRPGATETEFLEDQKRLAQLVYKRTMAIPSGRALYAFSIITPLPSQKLSMGTFNTSCRMQPSNVVVNADKSTFTEEKVCWAFFHSGVACGLSIARDAAAVDTSWLVLNKPPELGNRHAGLLLGLGLNGNLKSIAKWLAFKYLTPKHTVTSIGLLLGLAASHLGTMDSLITRLLSVHVTRLLPPGAAELNLGRVTQTAGIMGIGLLYHNTQHRRMSEVMLSEIEHAEAEYTADSVPDFRDEGYRLAAGFALGLINLGKGNNLQALHDLRLVERLLAVATGARDIDEVHVLDQATAAATMAIAIIFMKTQDEAVAYKVDVPSSVQQFDYVRPDILLLRAVAKNIIMWNEIEAEHKWIWKNLPKEYREQVEASKIIDLVRENPLNGRNMPFYNILAGLCWTISLKYAGTSSVRACDLLLYYYDFAKEVLKRPSGSYDENLTRNTLMKFLHLLALSAATVMAGSGNLPVLRRLRVLHATVNPDSDFGHHQASHMAMGILFLGLGKYTFNTSNLSVASLLCAFYPIFPKDVLDNTAHLQAFRHFWTFAAEARCVITKDVETNQLIVSPLSVTHRDGTVQDIYAPHLLPDLDSIATITTTSPEYWPVTLRFSTDPNHLAAFRAHQTIYLRRKSLLAQYRLNPFAVSLATRKQPLPQNRTIGDAFAWIFKLDAFRDFGVRQGDVVALLPRTQNTAPEQGRSLPVSYDRDRFGSLAVDSAPPIAATLDAKITGVDDLLVLSRCVESGRRDRLMGIKILLAWVERERAADRPRLWISDEGVEALRAELLSRMGRELAEVESETSVEGGIEMVVD